MSGPRVPRPRRPYPDASRWSGVVIVASVGLLALSLLCAVVALVWFAVTDVRGWLG